MNQVFIVGNLTRDPELSFTPSGVGKCKFDVAVNRSYKKGEEWVKEVTYIPVNCWAKTAENCNEFLRRGSKVAVSGRLSIRSYEDDQGVKKKFTNIEAQNIEFLTPKNADTYEQNSQNNDENLPF